MDVKVDIIIRLSDFVKIASNDLINELNKEDSRFSSTIYRYIETSITQLSVISIKLDRSEDFYITMMRKSVNNISMHFDRFLAGEPRYSKGIIIMNLRDIFSCSIRTSEKHRLR